MKNALVLGNISYGIPLSDEYSLSVYSGIPHEHTTKPDLIVFTGGEDVDPSMYKEDNIASFYTNASRDEWERKWFDYAVKNNVKMVGICRGMQLFTILTGGTLIQHVDGHGGNYHPIYDSRKQLSPGYVNSLHHQMCVPKKGTCELLFHSLNQGYNYTGTSETITNLVKYTYAGKVATDVSEAIINNKNNKKYSLIEPEALWFKDIKALGVQWHPEMANREHTAATLFKRLIKEYINNA